MKQEKRIWEKSRMELFREFSSQEDGLTQPDANLRLERYGANELQDRQKKGVFRIFWC